MWRRPGLFPFPGIFKDTSCVFLSHPEPGQDKEALTGTQSWDPGHVTESSAHSATPSRQAHTPSLTYVTHVLVTGAHTPLHPETHPTPKYTSTLLGPRDARTPASKHHTQLPAHVCTLGAPILCPPEPEAASPASATLSQGTTTQQLKPLAASVPFITPPPALHGRLTGGPWEERSAEIHTWVHPSRPTPHRHGLHPEPGPGAP